MTQTPEQWIEWCELHLRAAAKQLVDDGAPAGAVKAALTRIRGFGLQLDAELAEGPWQDISTAPKDGTVIVTYYPLIGPPHEFSILWWDRSAGTWWDNEGPSTLGGDYWMPVSALPTPPQEQE